MTVPNPPKRNAAGDDYVRASGINFRRKKITVNGVIWPYVVYFLSSPPSNDFGTVGDIAAIKDEPGCELASTQPRDHGQRDHQTKNQLIFWIRQAQEWVLANHANDEAGRPVQTHPMLYVKYRLDQKRAQWKNNSSFYITEGWKAWKKVGRNGVTASEIMETSLKAETSNGNLAGNVIEKHRNSSCRDISNPQPSHHGTIATNFSLKQSHNEQGNILSLQGTKEHTHSVESPSHHNANTINARRELTGHTCEQQETRTGNDDDIYIEDEELQYPQSPSSTSKDTPSSPVAPFPHSSRTDQQVDFDRIQQQAQQPPIQLLPPRSQAYSYAYLQSTAQLDARVHDNDQASLSDPLSCPAAAAPSHKIEVSPIPSKSDIGIQVSEFQLGVPSTALEQKITRLLEEAAAERREMVSSIRRLEKRIETLQNDTGRVHTCSCSIMKPQTCKRKRADQDDEDLEVVIGH